MLLVEFFKVLNSIKHSVVLLVTMYYSPLPPRATNHYCLKGIVLFFLVKKFMIFLVNMIIYLKLRAQGKKRKQKNSEGKKIKVLNSAINSIQIVF